MHAGSHISHGNLTKLQDLTCMNPAHFYITLPYKRREENYWLEYKGNGNNNFHNYAIRKVQTKIAMTTKHLSPLQSPAVFLTSVLNVDMYQRNNIRDR